MAHAIEDESDGDDFFGHDSTPIGRLVLDAGSMIVRVK
jgi:hypothetical protein